MSTQLPLKIRTGIRDLWDSPSSKLQISIQKLSALIGLPVNVNIDWGMTWSIIQKEHADVETFVPSVATIITQVLDKFAVLLEDDENQDWITKVLESVMRRKKVDFRVQTQPKALVGMSWHEEKQEFLVFVSEKATRNQSQTAAIHDSLLGVFTDKTAAQAQVSEDDFEHVNVAAPSATSKTSNKITTATPFPSLDLLPRPEILFSESLPYHIIVNYSTRGISIQGSHSQSIELIAAYFKKWCRKNEGYTDVSNPLDAQKANGWMLISDQKNFLYVALKESYYGHGIMYDAVKIGITDAKWHWVETEVVLVIAFIESVLGYEAVSRGEGRAGEWRFRREVGYV